MKFSLTWLSTNDMKDSTPVEVQTDWDWVCVGPGDSVCGPEEDPRDWLKFPENDLLPGALSMRCFIHSISILPGYSIVIVSYITHVWRIKSR